MARVDSLGHYLTDVASAIKTKKGDNTPIVASNFDTEIINLPSGSSEIEAKDVNFYDYDGTITNSYTSEEFLALSEMPSNPTHEGLVSQGWNWTLADAKEYVLSYDMLEIGQLYNTSDNKTRIYVDITNDTLNPNMRFGINGTATIDWGDNTTSTLRGTSIESNYNTSHTYSEPGSYVVTIYSESDIRFTKPSTTRGSYIFTNSQNNTSYNLIYQTCVKKIELSNNVLIGESAFGCLLNLETITIPSNLASFQDEDFGGLFLNCVKLKHVTYPSTLLRLGANNHNNNVSLKSVCLPKTFNEIDTRGFYYCTSLKRLSLSPIVNNIGAGAFEYCEALERISVPSNNITFNGTYPFAYCTKLKSLFVPSTPVQYFAYNCMSIEYAKFAEGITTISPYTFSTCYSLKNVDLPSTLTDISTSAFADCNSLTKVVFPASLTSIQASSFSNCNACLLFDFREATQIPTLVNRNAFNSINTNAKIVVPDDLYETWRTTTNWSYSTIQSKIVKASDYND